MLVAIAIGLHNLGEGLAIGSAYAVGALALGAFLVIGFALHNTTEGLAIVAPVAQQPAGPRRLALLGLIAGAPAILGAWIGASAFNSSLAAFLLGAGAGAIVQVIQQLVPSIRDRAGRALNPASVAGILAGFAILYATSLLVSVVMATRSATASAVPREAIENYAKAIYALEQRGGRGRHDQRARGAARRDAGLGVQHGEEARRARARHPRALQGREADRRAAGASRSRCCATTGCWSCTWRSRSACRGTGCTTRPRCSSTSSRRSSRS